MDEGLSKKDSPKKATRNGQLNGLSIAVTYLQFVQMQVEPQLQTTQIKFGLQHLM